MSPDDYARSKKWLILCSGEAYEKIYHRKEYWRKIQRDGETVDVLSEGWASVFVFLESDGRWGVWRASFVQGKPDPISQRIQGTFSEFERAIEKGESFIEWWRGRRK